MGQTEETGPTLSENLAEIISKVLKKIMPVDKLKALLDKYPRPDNISPLISPTVNNSIWQKLKHETRKADIRLGQIQDNVVKTVTATVKVVEKLSNLKGKLTD